MKDCAAASKYLAIRTTGAAEEVIRIAKDLAEREDLSLTDAILAIHAGAVLNKQLDEEIKRGRLGL